MEPDTQHDFENEQHFWEALEDTLSKECGTHSEIDDTLRSYLTFTSTYPEYIQNDHDIRRCAYNLYFSQLFVQHADYVRRQFVYCLLQEDEATILHITATLLLADAREHEETFTLLNEEGIFPRLIEMISAPRQQGEEDLHRQLMELLYEMARLQKVTTDDLICVDDAFIRLLFDIIEQVSQDVDDPYHYPVIRVLLVLNEQFMVAAHDPSAVVPNTTPPTNKVMKVLSAHGPRYKTFGENIILLLNREDETSLQLLTLKLLYLLFTTPPTYEYFYTNDLHVLVDILIRNLLDLPEEAAALRHTYLRVFYPLLEHTQLKNPPHYKQSEVRKLLAVLAGGHLISGSENSSFSHFEEVDETTKRLVQRCQTVSWIGQADAAPLELHLSGMPDTLAASSSATKAQPPALPAPRKLRKRTMSKHSGSDQDFLMPQLESARQSSLSVVEMAHQREKPGVVTPSRNASVKHGFRAAIMQKRDKPPPPKARKSGLTKLKMESKVESDAELSESPTATNDDSRDLVDPQTQPADTNNEEHKKPKQPPPAPKARRWRGKRTKEDDNVEGQSEDSVASEVGGTTITSLQTRDAPEHSPFSPPEEKTLSPFVGHDGKSSKKSKRLSSVSAALEQAQAQALQDLEKTLEQATIHEEDEEQHVVREPSLLRQAVLAPPSQAPPRDVPAPKVQLEKSPFIGPEESKSDIQGAVDHSNRIDEESEDEWN